VVRYISDWIAVIYLGEVFELGDADVIHRDAGQPYTEALISVVSEPTLVCAGQRIVLSGDIPNSEAPPAGWLCIQRRRSSSAAGM
jgi:ABC-type oligopeptide transport system ATPase subunit